MIAFELSKGCTFGCWFCGISAASYEGHLPYDGAGRALWRDVLASAASLLGPAMQTGTCYWATDPSDNPDYTRFLDDFREITGALPQTTTAGAIRDVRWTREVLAQAATGPATPTRFSVLSNGMLRRIHETFAAEELLSVELVLHNPESALGVARSGRALGREARRVGHRRARKPVAARPHCQCHQNGQRAEQGADRETFADIADDLMGVDEIVDRDEVEPHAEFVPEEPFGEYAETEREQQAGGDAPYPQPAQPASRPASAEHAFDAQQHGQHERERGQIEQQADTHDSQESRQPQLRGLPGFHGQHQTQAAVQQQEDRGQPGAHRVGACQTGQRGSRGRQEHSASFRAGVHCRRASLRQA